MSEFYSQFSLEINNLSLETGQSQQEIFFERITSFLIEDGECIEAIYPRPPFSEKGYQFDGYGGNPLDDDNKLIGVLTDGDARRAILEKKSLDLQVKDIMNTDFIFVNFRDRKKGNDLLINRFRDFVYNNKSGILIKNRSQKNVLIEIKEICIWILKT